MSEIPHNEDLSAPPLGPELACGKWKVHVIDFNGNITEENISGKQVWSMQNRRVMVDFNRKRQPIKDSGGLLGTWLGSLSYDFHMFPINYTDWRKVADYRKDMAWKVIQKKFWFDDANARKRYVISALGGRYKSKRLRERNTTNRSKLLIPHALGRKSLARKAYEMEEESGVEPTRGKLFIASRMRLDGSMICEEARIYAEKLKEVMKQKLPVGETSSSDVFAQVFGLGHPGHIRCIGRGPTRSKYFTSYNVDMQFQMRRFQEQNAEIVDLKSQMQKLHKKNAEIVDLKCQMQKLQEQNAEIVDLKFGMHNFGEKLDIVASALQKMIQVNQSGENIKIEQETSSNEKDNENGGNMKLASAFQTFFEACRVNGDMKNILHQVSSISIDKGQVRTQRLKRISSISGTSLNSKEQVGTQRH